MRVVAFAGLLLVASATANGQSVATGPASLAASVGLPWSVVERSPVPLADAMPAGNWGSAPTPAAVQAAVRQTEPPSRVFVGGSYTWSPSDHASSRIRIGEDRSMTGWMLEAGIRIIKRLWLAGEMLPYSKLTTGYYHRFNGFDAQQSQTTFALVGHVSVAEGRAGRVEAVAGLSVARIEEHETFIDDLGPTRTTTEESHRYLKTGFVYGVDFAVPVVTHVVLVPRMRFHTLPLDAYDNLYPQRSTTQAYLGIGARIAF